MHETTKATSFQNDVHNLIKSKHRNMDCVVMTEEILRFCEMNKECALLLSKLIYWTDKGNHPDGYIYKSAREWHKEIGLSSYEVKIASEWLEKKGIAEIKKAQAQGHPTMHYRLNKENLIESINKILTMDSENINNPLSKYCKSITETTTRTNSKTTIEQGVKSQSSLTVPFSLKAFLLEAEKQGELLEGKADAIEVIRYFLEQYKHHRREKHPRLKYDQWLYHINTILYGEDGFGCINDYALEDHEKMIDKYFETKFENCDYRLHHYNTDGVKERRFYEECY